MKSIQSDLVLVLLNFPEQGLLNKLFPTMTTYLLKLSSKKVFAGPQPMRDSTFGFPCISVSIKWTKTVPYIWHRNLFP